MTVFTQLLLFIHTTEMPQLKINTLVSTAIENDLFNKNSVLKQTHDFKVVHSVQFLSAYTIYYQLNAHY
jgi:hypothetical protein